MKIIISHVQKQHAYRLVYALQKENKLKKFYTSLYFKKDSFLTKMFKVNKKLSKLIPKRRFEKLDEEKIVLTYLPEVLSKVLNRLSVHLSNFYTQRLHDIIVSFFVDYDRCDIFIGYETQSLRSFKKAKKHGVVTILDAASIYFETVIKINERNDYIIRPQDKVKYIHSEGKVKSEGLQYTDHIIALSEFSKNSYIEAGFPKEKIKIISLGIDTSLFSLKQSYSFEKFEIIFVAGVRHLKGIKDLVEVFKSLNLDNSLLTIVGNKGDAYKYIKSNISKNIRYIPHVQHNELVKLYQDASIFVMPTYMDSFGQVIFEAMSCGTPVITTNHSGAPEYINNGKNGFIIDVANKIQLEEKILYFYNNKDEIEQMGKNARKSVEHLTWENYYQNINQFINNISRESK